MSARVLKVAFLPAWLLILGTRNLWGHYASRGLRRRNEQARAELWRKPLAPSKLILPTTSPGPGPSRNSLPRENRARPLRAGVSPLTSRTVWLGCMCATERRDFLMEVLLTVAGSRGRDPGTPLKRAGSWRARVPALAR